MIIDEALSNIRAFGLIAASDNPNRLIGGTNVQYIGPVAVYEHQFAVDNVIDYWLVTLFGPGMLNTEIDFPTLKDAVEFICNVFSKATNSVDENMLNTAIEQLSEIGLKLNVVGDTTKSIWGGTRLTLKNEFETFDNMFGIYQFNNMWLLSIMKNNNTMKLLTYSLNFYEVVQSTIRYYSS